jgi:hypothetical protein
VIKEEGKERKEGRKDGGKGKEGKKGISRSDEG